MRQALFDWDQLIAQLIGLPFELGFQRSFSRFVSGGPDRFVIFDLVLNHRVKDDGVLVSWPLFQLL